jgi:hypothetical protein
MSMRPIAPLFLNSERYCFSYLQFLLKSFCFSKMSAQRIQAMVRVTGNTFQVPLKVRSGRPGNSLRSNSPGRFPPLHPSGTKNILPMVTRAMA